LRDAAPRWIGCGIPQTSGVATKHPLDSLCVEALEDIANGGVGGRTLPAQTEGGVQPAAPTRSLDAGYCPGAIHLFKQLQMINPPQTRVSVYRFANR
jgi:hypothetical protein